MNEEFFFSIFEGLPRQGPGSDACTAKAFSMIPDIPLDAEILDIGCGSGMQTLALARLCPHCRITASDIHQPFLDDVMSRAKDAGLVERIRTVRASMDDLPFPEESFDLIWAEGSAFVMGFAEALAYWKKFLNQGGSMMMSDCVWFSDSPHSECREFFEKEYPAMKPEGVIREMILSAGYRILGTFRLPDADWWTHYYTPLSRRLDMLGKEHAGNDEGMSLILMIRTELGIHKKYSSDYGYTYFVMRKG